MITGKQLIEWGYSPGTYFKDALPAANAVAEAGGDIAAIRSASMNSFRRQLSR